MGGLLLKKYGLESKRIDIEQYKELESLLIQTFANNGIELYTIPYYHSKISFGDLDILVEKQDGLKELIQKEFNPKFIHVNDYVYSFDLNGFQIDLLAKDKEFLESARHYLGWNDISNIIGKVYNKMGLNYGWQGLKYRIKNNQNVLKEITLTTDPQEMIEFVGYDYDEYCKGFNTIEDIYGFVTKGKYFNRDIFAFENLNNINRTRNKKRAVYSGFLDWLDKNPQVKSNFDFESVDDAYWMKKILVCFPFLNNEIKKVNQELELAEQRKAKFNGNLIIEWYGKNFNPQQLGEIIKDYKESKSDWNLFLDIHTKKAIEKDFIHWMEC